jgi:cytochrome c peroxidase
MRSTVPNLVLATALAASLVGGCSDVGPLGTTGVGPLGTTGVDPVVENVGAELDRQLMLELQMSGFTGRIEERLTEMLGRPIDARLADIGRLLFFDPILSITQDNSCSGCHGPNVSFNDSQPISIGVDNNGAVGPRRTGPHNLRRAPSIINAALYPNLMWEGRFAARSLSPFDNSLGFVFPDPEGEDLSFMDHLLGAQAFTPVVSAMEMTGFDFPGSHDEIRAEIAARVDAIPGYRNRFAEVFPDIEAGGALTYGHIGSAIAEFGLTLVRADAPVDRYARGDTAALTEEQKRGGILFYEPLASCTECHITAGFTNEMFSDFESRVLAVPQVVPNVTNATFDGPGHNEDFGLERVTGDPADRYKFRTTPLRNLIYSPSLMHNGAFVCLEDAIRHHIDPRGSLEAYNTDHLPASLQGAPGPFEPMLERLHTIGRQPGRVLTDDQYRQLTDFVGLGLSDPDAAPDALRHLIPASVPSGLPVHDFDYAIVPPPCG